MAKYQQFLSKVGSNRDRSALRGIFSMFLTDDDPPALKDLTLASIVLSGAETTQITISGASTTGILQSGTSTTAYSITGAFTTGINIAADGTTAIAVTSAFSGVNMISLAGTGSTSGILVSGACGIGLSISGACTTAINIARATAKTAIRVGEWAGSQAAGSAVVFATNMAGLDTSQLNIIAAFGESTSDLTSAYSTSVLRGRHLVTAAADTVFTHEVYGVMGQVVCKNASFNHYASGVMGTFEASNTLTHVMSGYVAAAVTGRLGGAVLTSESGAFVAGVAAINNSTAHTATGTIAGFLTHKTAAGIAWPIGLCIPSGSATTAISLQSGSTIDDTSHLDIETLSDTKRIRLNDRNYAATSGDIVGFSAKPAANATGTQTVYGGQISPRANDNVDVAALIGLQVEPILKGATVLAVSGDMRGLDVRLTSEGANTVGGIAGCYFAYNLLKSATFTGGVYPFVVKANGDTQAWTALMEIPIGLSGAADGSGSAVYIPITIDGVAARITAKYVS